tara:strand:+ start:740 stop:1585 length:846 start_codon:yes stop_codon:yes gene_type:complete
MSLTNALDGGALWTSNNMDTATIAASVGGSAALLPNYPASNLNNPMRTKRFRATHPGGGSDMVTFTIVTPSVAVNAIAFVDWNLPESDKTFSLQTFSGVGTYLLYPYQGDHGVARYYLGTPSSGTWTSPTTVYTLTFQGDYSLPDSYMEIGEIYLGSYTNIDIATPANIGLQDPSTRAQSYGGQEYVEPMTRWTKVDFNLLPMTQANMYTMEQVVDAVGPGHVILDMHGSAASTDGASTAPSTLDKASTYYGRLRKGQLMKQQLKGANNNVIGLSFDEARK